MSLQNMTNASPSPRRLPPLIWAAAVVCLLCIGFFALNHGGGEPRGSRNLTATNQGLAQPAKAVLVPSSYDHTNRNADAENVGSGSSPPVLSQPADSARLLQVLKDRTANLADRTAAADALGKMGVKEAVEPLQQILGDNSEALTLKYKAARALGVINDEKAVPTLSALLENQTTDRHLRVVSALALGNLGTTDALQALGRAEQDSDSLIRFKVVQALETSHDSTSREIVVKALSDSDIYVQARAIHTLGKLGGESSITTVNQILRSTESDFIRIACFTALGDINQQEAVTILRQYENHTNQLISLNARAALQRLNLDKSNQP